MEKRADAVAAAETAAAPPEREGREEGIFMIMVLLVITLLAVLGATTLLLMASSLVNARATLPSSKAFDVAESGLSVAHSELARDLVPAGGKNINGSLEPGATYSVTVVPDPALPDWKITSTGTYTVDEGGQTRQYQRVLEERVTFQGTQKYFNALEYVLFSKEGRINIEAGTVFLFNNFRVNGSIYGKDVTLYSNKLIFGDSELRVNGNVYATRDATVRTYTGFACVGTTRVAGSTPMFPSLGEGVFANRNVTLRAECVFLASSRVYIDDNCYYGNTITKSTGGLGINTISISGTEKKMDASTGNVPDVALPEPDFDWYRAQAKVQDADPWPDGVHYYPGNATINSLTINPNAQLSSGWIGFCEGNLTIQNVFINANAKGVFVAMGNVSITHTLQLQGSTEYQAMAKGKVIHNSSLTFNIFATDTIFIYSGYSNPNDLGDYAVQYSLGWFRDIKGQITAKGSIYTPDSDWAIAGDNGITYKKPNVPVDGFPIPFQVKSWKEL
jgi:hypothetical protein